MADASKTVKVADTLKPGESVEVEINTEAANDRPDADHLQLGKVKNINVDLDPKDLLPSQSPMEGKDANEVQVGGAHYQTEYQHWDWTIDIKLGQLEYAASKYIARSGKKEGEPTIEGLQKSIHYIRKAAEAWGEGRYHNNSICTNSFEAPIGLEMTTRFMLANNLNDPLLWRIIFGLATWTSSRQLSGVIDDIQELIQQYKEAEGSLKLPRGTNAGGASAKG